MSSTITISANTTVSGTASDPITITSGETVDVFGSAVYFDFESGAVENVYSGGDTTDGLVNSGATEYVYSGGETFFTDVGGESLFNALSSFSGGTLVITPGGYGEYDSVASGGNIIISSGGEENVGSVSAGGIETVLAGGSAGLEFVSAGGTLDVFGSSINTILLGGTENVSSGGQTLTTTVSAGGTQVVDAGGSTVRTTVDSGGTQQLLAGGSADGTFLAEGGTIDVTYLTYASGGSAVLDPNVPDQLDITVGGVSATLQLGGPTEGLVFPGDYAGESFSLSPDAGSGTDITVDTTPCYCRGTLILTDRGDVAVEDLRIGDHVITRTGTARPIRWTGHRAVDCMRHPDPSAVWPIRIQAGAFSDTKPSRGLWVSPGHSILFDGVLIPAEKLVNCATVVQERSHRVEYWHVELDRHDIILAEGLPAESYLDTGNRTAFINGGAFLALHPDFRPKHWTEGCLPLVFDGPELVRAKTVLLEKAAELGHVITAEADLHIMADGKRIEPVWLTETRVSFMLSFGCSHIALRSRRFIPAHINPASSDDRPLGLAVGRLQIDGSDVAIEDDAALLEGWHQFERHPNGHRQRWTVGETPIPPNTRLIVIDIAGRGYYWDKRHENVVVLSEVR
jgi:autotransporter passenger strand-loop-strand repeat protein